MNKNHEGYTDYTACEAVRRADRDRKRKRIGEPFPPYIPHRGGQRVHRGKEYCV